MSIMVTDAHRTTERTALQFHWGHGGPLTSNAMADAVLLGGDGSGLAPGTAVTKDPWAKIKASLVE